MDVESTIIKYFLNKLCDENLISEKTMKETEKQFMMLELDETTIKIAA